MTMVTEQTVPVDESGAAPGRPGGSCSSSPVRSSAAARSASTPTSCRRIARQIATVVRRGIQVAVVVGGGNFFRGAELQKRGMDRTRADYMGMLGTVMNCLALQDFLEKEGIETRVQTAITMAQVAEPYIPLRAIRHLEKGRVVIFGAGAGMPYFSTDTVSAQRALEIHADVVLMSKNGVDGVYTADPRIDPNARKFDTITFAERAPAGPAGGRPGRVQPVQGERPADARLRGRGRRHDHPRRQRREDRYLDHRVIADPSPPPDHQQKQGGDGAVIDETLFEAEEKMESAVEHAKEEFAAIRTGRANAAMFSKIVVDYYGAPTPVTQMASVGVPEPRMVIVKPYDASQLGPIERAIRDSDLGVNPNNEGTQLRIHLPQMTEERRREMIKIARTKAEEGRVAIRNVRRKAKEQLDRLVKDGEAGEDDGRRAEKELDDVTHRYVAVVDELVKHKEAELLEV